MRTIIIDTNSALVQSSLVAVYHDLVAHFTVRVIFDNDWMDAFTFDVLRELSHLRRG